MTAPFFDYVRAAGDDVIIVELGLSPDDPCPEWDKSRSSVTNRAGEKIGFVDMNDGLHVHIYLRTALVNRDPGDETDAP